MDFWKKYALSVGKRAGTILALCIFVASSLIQALPARAAVPVSVVGNNAGTEFERTLEEFLFNLAVAEKKFDFELLMNLRQREEDFTASFELQKIEKAREDVNKLMLETLKELQNRGQLLGSGDFIAGGTLGTPSILKGPRIIQRPFDYIYAEPIAAGRAAMLCYYDFIIWDQQGWLLGDDSKATYATRPNSNSTVETFEMEDSIKLVKALRAKSILRFGVNTNVSAEIGHNAEGNPEDSDVSIFFNESDPNYRDTLRNICFQIFETFGLISPHLSEVIMGPYEQDLKTLDSAGKPILSPKALSDLKRSLFGLPTLKIRVIGRRGVTREEINEGDRSINTFRGLQKAAEAIGNSVANAIANIHALNYIAGQGIRPESLYVEFEGPEAFVIDAVTGEQIDVGIRYPFDTGYVIAPAAVLLQKMQSATQSQFDLAQQGFMYLNPWSNDQNFSDVNANFLSQYNLKRVSPKNELGIAGRRHSLPGGDNVLSMDLVLPTVSTKGSFVEDEDVTEEERARMSVDITQQTIGIIGPWLRPAPKFRSTTKPGVMEIGNVRDFELPVTGLPAPWEDESDYLAIGSYGDRRYRIDNYRPNRGEGDNISEDLSPGGKWLGMDYGINDWFDRVLEMYEPSPTAVSGGAKYGFDTRDWRCLLTTWLRPVNPKTREVLPSKFEENCEHRILDRSY